MTHQNMGLIVKTKIGTPIAEAAAVAATTKPKISQKNCKDMQLVAYQQECDSVCVNR